MNLERCTTVRNVVWWMLYRILRSGRALRLLLVPWSSHAAVKLSALVCLSGRKHTKAQSSALYYRCFTLNTFGRALYHGCTSHSCQNNHIHSTRLHLHYKCVISIIWVYEAWHIHLGWTAQSRCCWIPRCVALQTNGKHSVWKKNWVNTEINSMFLS